MDVSTRGKAITLFVSPRIIDDYTTGLGNERRSVAKTLKSNFKRKYSRNVKLDTPDKNRFLVKKIMPDTMRGNSPKVADKYDQAYLDLLVHIKNHRLWKDRAIIVASRDEVLLASLQNEAAREHETWLHVAHDLKDLEDLIRC